MIANRIRDDDVKKYTIDVELFDNEQFLNPFLAVAVWRKCFQDSCIINEYMGTRRTLTGGRSGNEIHKATEAPPT